MELWGAGALGIVVGWLMPWARRPTVRSMLVSLAMAGIVSAWLAVQWGGSVALFAVLGMVAASLVHATWLDVIVRRSRLSNQGGG